MTKEEAIYKAKHLKKVRPNICIDSEDFWEIVIAALEQEPVFFPSCQDCNAKMDEIRRAYDKLQEQQPCDDATLKDIFCMGCEYREQEPCDAVSRKEVMNMLHNHAFDYATSTKISALLKTMRVEVDRMPPVTPAEKVGHCEDCVSREAVLDLCDSKDEEYKVRHFREDVECLPPVYPKQRMGHWISDAIQGEIDGQLVKAFICSECGAISVFRITGGKIVNGDSCANCRAKMEVEE